MALAKALSKRKKKWIIALSIIVVLVVVLVVSFRTLAFSAGPSFPFVEASPLQRKVLQNVVSVTGNVESTEMKKVYSRLQYPVTDIFVEVGDRVQEGDVLCQLDTKDLENSIAKAQANMNRSQTTASISLTDAQRELTNARDTLESDLNSQLLQAEQQVRTAEANVRTAESNVRAAESGLDRAAVNLTDSRQTYRDAVDNYLEDSIINTYRNAERSAQIQYDEAKNAVADAKSRVNDAKRGVEDAQVNYDAVQMSVEQQMNRYESNVENARRSMDFTPDNLSIQDLQEDLKNCTITSPVSGTVTAIYAEEGAPASGLMFVIEDTESLKVKTKVVEYDIASVDIGNHVEVRSDATGEDIYRGRLSKIAPTSVKTALGNSDTSSETEFETEISIIGPTKLKIGMRTRLNIIYEEKKDVLAVAYDAIVQNEYGEDVVFVARTDENGDTFVHSVAVTLGMETEFDTEISSDGLSEGDMIVSNPDGLTDGMQVMMFDGMTMGVPGMHMMRGSGGGTVVVMG